MMVTWKNHRYASLHTTTARALALLLALAVGCRAWTASSTERVWRPALESATARRPRLPPLHSASVRGENSDAPTTTTTTVAHTTDPCDSAAPPGATALDWDWRAVAEGCFAADAGNPIARPIILFDGVCLFCNAGVDLCLRLDGAERFRFASLQSRVGQALQLRHGRAADDLSSIVLVDRLGEAHVESDAILRIARELTGLPAIVRGAAGAALRVVPAPLRNAAYHVVANNRHRFGSRDPDECRLDLDGTLARRFVEDPPE